MDKRAFGVLLAALVALETTRVFADDYQPAETKVFNVKDYGAVGDGLAMDTEAVQKTIDACHTDGGGIVRVPSGDFQIGTIWLRSNITLSLDHGASLLGSLDIADYKTEGLSNPREGGPHCLIYAEKARNIVIEGLGVIDGRGTPEHFPRIRSGGRETSTRPRLIRMVNCSQLTFSGVTYKLPAFWGLHLIDCRNLHFNAVTIRFRNNGYNNDGLDLDGCENVLIENCEIDAGDDAICLKSSLNPCRNIVVRNCKVSSNTAPLKFGTSSRGPYMWVPFPRTAAGQGAWSRQHIQTHHGALGALFPDRIMRNWHFIEGGGTIPWAGLANHGLAHPEHLYWGGWSGRFSRTKHKNVWSRHAPEKADEQKYGDFYMFEADSEEEQWTEPVHNETFNSFMVPVWRFRRAMFNDSRARMDWCVKEFHEANHNPVAAVNGDKSNDIIHLQVSPGQKLTLDASASSDPDSDTMTSQWWVYKEAGTYSGNVTIANPDEDKIQVTMPTDAGGKEIHIILEVLDKNQEIGMYDYRRVVLEVI